MFPLQLISVTASLIGLSGLIFHFVKTLRQSLPKDYSEKRGNIKEAVMYSFTGAMSPRSKESAHLHLPTYFAGMIYHLGTFLSFILYILFILDVNLSGWMRISLLSFLLVSCLSGLGIFIKRIVLKKLRYLSNPDDYVSNILVTAFQLFTIPMLLGSGTIADFYYVSAILFFLYLPLGKLKHSLYFFLARYHLGLFYGWRGVWPVKNFIKVK